VIQTPLTVLNGLLPEPTRIGAVTLPPFTLARYLLLVKIDSPLVAESAVEVDEVDMMRSFYALAAPVDECVAHWALGRETFDAAAMLFSQCLTLDSIAKLPAKLAAHVQAGFSAAAKTGDPDQPKQLADIGLEPSSGTGWVLRFIGRMTTIKSGWTIEYVMNLPLAQLFLLWTENELANGAEWDEPSYEERDGFDETAAAVAALRR
jgi:hypothetical protein